MKTLSLIIAFTISLAFISCGSTRSSDCGLSKTDSKEIKFEKKDLLKSKETKIELTTIS